jgi:hypothetical protein
MSVTQTESRPGQHEDFVVEADRLMTRIRDLFGAVIQSTCGSVAGAHEVADRLAIHRKLGWQVWKVAYGDEPFLAARYMPSRKGIETWLTAAERLDVPAELVAGVREVSEAFERLTRTHATDREMLEMMFDSCGSHQDEQTDIRWRKQAFAGNSYIHGVHAKALVSAAFMHPSDGPDDGYFDLARLHGLVQLVRTRPEVRWPIAQTVLQIRDESQTFRRTHLDRDVDVGESTVPLLPQFCSDPLPQVTRQAGQAGLVEDVLEPGPVGQRGALTVMTGEIWRRAGRRYRVTTNGKALFGIGVRTPIELLQMDQYVHRALFGDVERRLKVFSELISPVARDEHDRVVVPEQVQALGRGLRRIHASEITRYSDMVRYVFERTGWNPDDFDVFRVRMQYAPIAVSVMMENDLPDPPGEGDT